MQAQTLIFIGKSGSGKGTQANLLQLYLEKKDSHKVIHLETGAEFRKFIKSDNYTAKLLKKVVDGGGLAPDSLAVYTWTKIFIENFNGDDHIITDGMPRKLEEAKLLDGLLNFYDRKKIAVIYLDVSSQMVIDRLLKRGKETGRADDLDIDTIKKRLAYFESDVWPVVDFYRQNSGYSFFHIDGEPTVEEIGKDIISRLELSE